MATTIGIAQAQTDLAYNFNTPSYDTFIRNTSGVIVNSPGHIFLQMQVPSGDAWVERSAIEWDISDFPTSGITVTEISLLYTGGHHDSGSDCHIHECLGERPSTAGSIGDLYDEIGEGTVYADIAGFPVNGANQAIVLGTTSSGTACVDFTNQLSSGWFAIGMQLDTESGGPRLSDIKSADSTTANPYPSLLITYNLATSTTLSQPVGIVRGHTRKVESYLMGSTGNLKRLDSGSGGKTLTLTGIEPVDPTSNFTTLDAMMNIGYKITLSDMAYDDLNTDWYILDFNWEQNPAYVSRYDWNLVLLEA